MDIYVYYETVRKENIPCFCMYMICSVDMNSRPFYRPFMLNIYPDYLNIDFDSNLQGSVVNTRIKLQLGTGNSRLRA